MLEPLFIMQEEEVEDKEDHKIAVGGRGGDGVNGSPNTGGGGGGSYFTTPGRGGSGIFIVKIL